MKWHDSSFISLKWKVFTSQNLVYLVLHKNDLVGEDTNILGEIKCHKIQFGNEIKRIS
jgi:hypothetical protein